MPKTIPTRATWFLVPAGTESSRCKGILRGGSCDATIYFVANPKTGKLVPVDCDVPDGQIPGPAVDPSQIDAFSGDPGEPQHGRGVSHYLCCPDADLFTRGAR